MKRLAIATVLVFVFVTPSLADSDECKGNYGERREIYEELLLSCERLAQNGDVESQTILGMLYEEGSKNRFPNYHKAAMWFRKAAEQGDSNAQWWLGQLYMRGVGVLQDFAAARQLFKQSAEQDKSFAKWDLGKMYRDGMGVSKDYVLAHMWLNLTAADGYRVAAAERDALAKLMTPTQIAEAQRLAKAWKPK